MRSIPERLTHFRGGRIVRDEPSASVGGADERGERTDAADASEAPKAL